MKLVANWNGYPEATYQIQSNGIRGALHVEDLETGRPACNVRGTFVRRSLIRHTKLGRLTRKSPSPVCIRCWKLARNAQTNERNEQ